MGKHLDTKTWQASDKPALQEITSIPCLTIAYHFRADRVGQRALLDWDGTTSLSRLELSFAHPGEPPIGPLEDPYLSRAPISFIGHSNHSIEIRPPGANSN
jgi:hypothetical protein